MKQKLVSLNSDITASQAEEHWPVRLQGRAALRCAVTKEKASRNK